MTNFAIQSTLGPVISPLVSKDKGSMGNRIDCAGAQLKNNVTTTLQAGAVVAGSTAAAYGIGKSSKLAKAAAKVFDAIVNGFGRLFGKSNLAGKLNKTIMQKAAKNLAKNNANFGADVLKKTLNNIRMGKGGLLIAAVALPLLSYIGGKHIYKAGQIDQKYTDKAQFQKTL